MLFLSTAGRHARAGYQAIRAGFVVSSPVSNGCPIQLTQSHSHAEGTPPHVPGAIMHSRVG
jgi:hypothetical protein